MISLEPLRRTLNIMLIRGAGLEVDGKTPEQISFGEVFGYMDAVGYLILLLSLAATLAGGFMFGLIVTMIWPEPALLGAVVTHFPIVCAVPGVVIGFITWHFLFRMKRSLAS